MKKIYVNQLKDHLAEEIQELFYLVDIQYTDNGNRWLTCLLTDCTGRMSGKSWSQNMNLEWEKYCGHVVLVTGMVEIYKDIYSLNIFNIEPVNEGAYDILDFLVSVNEEKRNGLICRFQELTDMVAYEPYRLLLEQAYGKEVRFKKLCELPGEQKSNYAYRGGWLERTVEITELSISLGRMCMEMRERIFHRVPEVNRDLLITGALLHDIGKLSALKPGIQACTTRRGYLVGSTNDSVTTVSVLNNLLPTSKKVHDTTALLHVVASAGKEEGEIPPQLVEGMIVAAARRTLSDLNSFYSVFMDYDHSHPYAQGKEMVFSKYFNRMLMRGGEKNV